MSYNTISSRLSKHRYTIVAIAALVVFQWLGMPSTIDYQQPWHAAIYALIGVGVLVAAGGHRVLIERLQTTKTALGMAAVFTSIPATVFTVPEVFDYLYGAGDTTYVVGGEVQLSLAAVVVRELAVGAELQFWVIFVTVATILAATGPADAAELRETFWFCIPVVAAIITFSKSMDALYGYLVPGMEAFNFGVGAYAVETIDFIYFSIVFLAISWELGVLAYTRLDLSATDGQTDATDGGKE